MRKFDVFVVGSGMAGMNIANRCAAKGLKVGITDELPYGGTCALRGCDPKKIMLAATETKHMATNLSGKDISTIPEIFWKEAMQSKQHFLDGMPPKIETGYAKSGVETFHSSARFVSKNQILVGEETIQAEKIVIATGARPRKLDFPGGDLALTSTDFLNFQELPQSIIFIGGGYVAMEFAHMAARYGSKVTIIHRGKRPLENFDPFIVEQITKATEELDINLVLNTEVSAIEESDLGYKTTGKGKTQTNSWEAEVIINSAGRPPAIFDLDLEKAGIDFNQQGIQVNEYLQSTSNPNVYAAGDAAHTDGHPLTPVAVNGRAYRGCQYS
ncbi:MAG: NAD(P)/FAD-dependent oxidoreductase [Cyclobacteriaceae bacterium]